MEIAGSILNNRYRLDQKIGEGGFAQVFLATDLELGRQTALKILGSNWSNDPELLTRFRNEARTVALLDHPNILLIYDFGVAKGLPYIVMPYVNGGTLEARLKQERLTMDEITFYLDQIGSALDYAHQFNIIHRDVKPSNMLLRPNGQLVLMDFGLAKLLVNSASAENTIMVGTPAYLAPEQIRGTVSIATDLYMLGVVLYHMLTGKIPFTGDTAQVLVGHTQLLPDSLVGHPAMSSLHPAVVHALNAVILQALAKNPAERYPSCQALSNAYQAALRAASSNGPISHIQDKNQPQQQPDETIIVLEQQKILATPVTPARQLPDETIIVLEQQKILATPAELDADATLLAPHARRVMLKPPRLSVTTDPDKGFRATFDLTGETLTLGRAPDNNLHIPLATISRYHALLQHIPSQEQEPMYKIVQRKVTNPLCCDGKEIQEKILKNHDVIEIGKPGNKAGVVKLTYHAPEYGLA